MSVKGAIKEDHMPLSKYEVTVAGLPPLTFINVSGMENEIEAVTLPDRTVASGGQTKPGTFTAKVPLHHTIERKALEAWHLENKDPKSPTAKKVATFTAISGTGTNAAAFTLLGVWPTKWGLPEFSMENEGEMATQEWSFSFDDILPLS